MEPETSVPCSEEPAPCLRTETDQSNTIHFTIILPSKPGLPSGSFPQVFLPRTFIGSGKLHLFYQTVNKAPFHVRPYLEWLRRESSCKELKA